MSVRQTEAMHDAAKGLDQRPAREILSVLAHSQSEAAKSVEAAIPALEIAAKIATDCLQSDGRLIYAGAGSSGLMAMADALELPGTYGIGLDKILILMAGGFENIDNLAGGYEDDVLLGKSDAMRAEISPNDCIICVSASGSTPYVVSVSEVAIAAGAKVISFANNQDAPLFSGAHVAVLLSTPPEVISGSTRMGAGTAQKIALNMFSTLMAIHLGHVFDGHMVNLRADNEKLKPRSARRVADIAGRPLADARQALDRADGSVKAAVLLFQGVPDAAVAQRILDANGQNLRRALSTGSLGNA